MKTLFFTHETGFQQTLPYSYVTLLSAALAPRIDRCFRSHPPEAARFILNFREQRYTSQLRSVDVCPRRKSAPARYYCLGAAACLQRAGAQRPGVWRTVPAFQGERFARKNKDQALRSPLALSSLRK